ncbi:Zn(II)2Cys6 transcription factor domain-containing protein [Aspergillus mulundensis]|uniref:Putative transcription factor with C2H2 and Zn(2)-Cys(6) DNA binding n=1 Tax=Aspergillus mulundensis TaxID=1810919 RepID=A0A3D8RYH0_9EURO|nr:putative transcription factor with C2H2 and Zn(2)-Cys(6) DNA binding [Aspergillus mulundensis]RDW79107.1 putative transcription factor with C2H2 and Zn(2)-Cys(6) DNA binding [Aspergillus mulundensis]
MSFPNKSPRVRDAASLHQCPECDRAYERPDHLARHLDSRAPQREDFSVYYLPARLQPDVLQRHQLIHTGDTPTSKSRGRAVEACEQCAAAKASCDNDNPCNRCQRKGIRCTPRKSNQRRRGTLNTITPETGTPRGQFGSEIDGDGGTSPSTLSADRSQNPRIPLGVEVGVNSMYSPTSPASSVVPFPVHMSSQQNMIDNLSEFPAFFEHVMMPSDLYPAGIPNVQQPRGVFDFMGDPGLTSPDLGLFGSDILVDLDKILEYNPSPAAATSYQEGSAEEQSTKQRVAAFRKSLWLWVPEKNQNGFSEHGQIPLQDGDMTASISSLHRSRLEALNIRGKLTQQMRDNIFQLVLATGGSRLSVPSFPTAESLDALIKIGISKRTETDAWIHPYTLYRQDSRPELLTALVAAGCVCSAIPSVGKAGVLLLEIVRVSLAHLVESDNSVLRDLQYFQASMMWLDIGIFCGYKRKMQIAESHLQPLCTALRRAGAFDRSFYTQLPSVDGLQGLELETAWEQWVQTESLKRLAYHLFEHDVEAAAAMNRPALTSYAEFTLPFPSARDLWLAPTATAWKELLKAKYFHASPPDLSLKAILADSAALTDLPANVDVGVVNSALLHGLMSQVWAFRQQASLMDSGTDARAVTRLWLQSRQDELSLSIDTAVQEIASAPPNAALFSEYALMHLHVNFDSVQRFAGQFGEVEARREYPKLREWALTKEARTSVWHAGQVLRAARQVLPFHLRGFDSLAIYHAILVLWVFGLLRCGEKQQDKAISLANGNSDALVSLDSSETDSIKPFISRDLGQPGLTLHSAGSEGTAVFCQLTSPRLVMDVGRQVFESNFPGALDNLPPLVQNLRNLIRDLGSLP